jgi:hypothetical protein
MSDELPNPPCGYCGKEADFLRNVRSDGKGGEIYGYICRGCVRLFIIEMAAFNPEGFEEMVEEARTYIKPRKS